MNEEDGRSKKYFQNIKVLKIFIVITFCKKYFLKKIEEDGRSKK